MRGFDSNRRHRGPDVHKGPRPATDEDREVHAAFSAGESLSGIARRLGRTAAWVTDAVKRVHDERAEAARVAILGSRCG